MNKFKNHFNERDVQTQKERNHGKSATIPDQSLTVRQILDRYAKGLPLNANNHIPVYTGDTEIPDIKRMDLAEVEAYKDDLAEAIEKKQQQIEDIKKQKADEKAKAKQTKQTNQADATDTPDTSKETNANETD